MDGVKTNYTIPVAIIIAGLIVGGAIFFGGRGGGDENIPAREDRGLEKVRPVSADRDHILGSPNAPVKIVEFSDLECPFCKSFHNTMHQVMDVYGKDGRVAWVYRHLPLSIHPKALPEAEASECAAELGGNEKFWKYIDRFFELTPSNNQTDIETVLPQIAREINLDQKQFEECLKSGRHRARIEEDINDAVNSGATGTPHSIVIAQNGEKFEVEGAVRFEGIKAIIDQALVLQ